MLSIPALLRPFATTLRGVNGLLRRIPAIDDFEDRLAARYLSQVVVRRIVNPKDSDLHSALELYEKRLPDDLRFESADIVRWLAEDRKKAIKRSPLARDYFLVAKHQRKVKGFVFFHFYPRRKIAFLAYMVVNRDGRGLGRDDLSRALVSRIVRLMARDKLLKNCKALVFEVEDPRRTLLTKERQDLARIRRFCTLAAMEGFVLRAFDFEYHQPPLALPHSEGTPGQPLLLVSAQIRPRQSGEDLRSELLEILEFIYIDLYPNSFSDFPEEQSAYEAYCRSLHSKIVANVPTDVRIINPIHLTGRRPSRKRSTAQQSRA